MQLRHRIFNQPATLIPHRRQMCLLPWNQHEYASPYVLCLSADCESSTSRAFKSVAWFRQSNQMFDTSRQLSDWTKNFLLWYMRDSDYRFFVFPWFTANRDNNLVFTSSIASFQSGNFSEDMIPTVGFNMRKVTKGNVTIKVWGETYAWLDLLTHWWLNIDFCFRHRGPA